MPKIKVQDSEITVTFFNEADYILPTDMVRSMENGLALGIIARSGRYGGTFAHKDIAFEFASWIFPQFKLYLIREFQRLKEEEQRQLGWDIKRNLARINYRIHTDAIKENLIPPQLTRAQINLVYVTEADVLNMALFGMTAKQWRDAHSGEKGNIRDYAGMDQLVCLSNLENLNAHFINEGIQQSERLAKLNSIAIQQMNILAGIALRPITRKKITRGERVEK